MEIGAESPAMLDRSEVVRILGKGKTPCFSLPVVITHEQEFSFKNMQGTVPPILEYMYATIYDKMTLWPYLYCSHIHI